MPKPKKMDYVKKPYTEDYTDPERDIVEPKLEKGNPIMLTLSPDNNHQYQSMTVQHRLNKFNDRYHTLIQPMLKKFLIQYEMSMEITEQLCSEGDKYFPRLHYHIVGVIHRPIVLYMQLTNIMCSHGIGYHVQVINTAKDMKHYQEYILKQRELWDNSPYTVLHKETYKKPSK